MVNPEQTMVRSQINKKDNSTYNMQEDTENSGGCKKEKNG